MPWWIKHKMPWKIWWRSLSINQMKDLERKYFPHWQSMATDMMVQEMWYKEDEPPPNTLVPVS